jgi:D-cysteine desulfhydrase
LVAVRVVPWPVACRLTVQVLAARTQGLLQALLANPAQPPPPRPRLQIRGGFVGAGYGDPSAAAVEAVRWASEHGLNLEPTYTGKTLAALLSDVRAGRLRGQRVLFINSYNSADLSHLAAHGDLNQLPPWLQSRIALPRLP